MGVVTASVLGSTAFLGTAQAFSSDRAVESTSQATAETKLPGCNSARSNIGGVTSLTVKIEGSTALLSWKAPETREGWSVDGYMVYRLNPYSGVMELNGYTGSTNFALELPDFAAEFTGGLPIQIAASGMNSDRTEGEEGCRSGRVMSGKPKLANSRVIKKKNYDRVGCDLNTTRTHFLVMVTGFYKGNAKVVAPASFGLAMMLYAPAREFARPASIWTFNEFRKAIKEWTSEVIDPGQKFKVSAIRCIKP